MRLPHDTWDIAKMPSWLKLSLGNQEDMLDSIRWQQNELWRQRASAGTSTALSPKSKPVTLSKPPQSNHTSYASAQTFSPPPHKPKPISPPVSAFSPQARLRTSGQRTSSSPLPKPSPLKTSTTASSGYPHSATAAQSSAIHSPSPKHVQHSATFPAQPATTHSPHDLHDATSFHTPPTTFTPYRPPTFLAPITPTAPLSAPPSPAPSNQPLPPAVPSPAPPGAHAPAPTPAGGASSPYVASATHPPYPLHPPPHADSPGPHDVSPYASTRHDSSRNESASPRREDAADAGGGDGDGPAEGPGEPGGRSKSPANLPELLRPAAPSRERSSPALAPGRVRGGDERQVPAAELEGSSR